MALMCSTSIMMSLDASIGEARDFTGCAGAPNRCARVGARLGREEALQQYRKRLRLVVVQHVARWADDVPLDLPDDVQPLVELGFGVARAPPGRNIGAVAFDPHHRGADQLPELEDFVALVEGRSVAFVDRVGA